MSENSILEFVDLVISKIDAPDGQKIQIENELIRVLMDNVEKAGIDEVKNSLSYPEKYASVITKKLIEKNLLRNEYNEVAQETINHKDHHPIYPGEFMQELNNLNVKLLYIPLIQISSRTSRLIMPLIDD